MLPCQQTCEQDFCSFSQDSGRGGSVPIVMALGSCDFAYIRVHRRIGKHRVLDEQEIKRYKCRFGADKCCCSFSMKWRIQ